MRKERAMRLRMAGETARRQFFESRMDTIAEVLIEKDGINGLQGHCPHFAPVHGITDDSGNAQPGTIVSARIVGINDDHLIGKRAA